MAKSFTQQLNEVKAEIKALYEICVEILKVVKAGQNKAIQPPLKEEIEGIDFIFNEPEKENNLDFLNDTPNPDSVPMIKRQRYLIILDAGHGGLNPITGEYVTAPSKMWKHKEFTFYEGVYNRLILGELTKLLDNAGYDYEVVSHEWKDNSLKSRTDRANEIFKKEPCLYFSIHGNAFPPRESANGFEVFTSKGHTQSDLIATQIGQNIMTLFPDEAFRMDTTDGDLDKEDTLAVTRDTDCYSTLTEFGFFTNEEQAKKMLTREWQFNCALALFNAIGWSQYNLK